MSVPTLTRNIQRHQVISKLKSSYSILTQAVQSAQRDNGEASEWTTERWTEKGAIDIAENLKPYFKIMTDCGTYDDANKCVNSQYKRRDGLLHDVKYATDRRYYKIVLQNGLALIWKATDGDEFLTNSVFTIFVDINNSAPPNKWGEDFFSFSYRNGKLVPGGAPDSTNPYDKACLPKGSPGYGCAFYILTKNKMDY